MNLPQLCFNRQHIIFQLRIASVFNSLMALVDVKNVLLFCPIQISDCEMTITKPRSLTQAGAPHILQSNTGTLIMSLSLAFSENVFSLGKIKIFLSRFSLLNLIILFIYLVFSLSRQSFSV